MNESSASYEAPTIVDHGRLRDLTANDGQPVVTDVPGGTPVNQGPIIGSHYSTP